MKDLLLIRADATTQIGTGHVMRCLALAQAWKASGGEVSFLQSSDSAKLGNRLEAESFRVVRHTASSGTHEDGVHTSLQARTLGARWIVLDGYHFRLPMQEAILQGGHRFLQVDDMALGGPYVANVILNQNSHACEMLYRDRRSGTDLLLGTRYALLRREFLTQPTTAESAPGKARKVLVTLGGSDPDNVTLKVVQALKRVTDSDDQIEAKVLAGPANPHLHELRRATEGAKAICLMTSTAEMPQVMSWADVAIAAGGSTCWELAFMGLPSLILILADNQVGIAQDMDRQGAAVNLGWHQSVAEIEIAKALSGLLKNREQRSHMSSRGRTMVDGRGAARVVSFLREGKR